MDEKDTLPDAEAVEPKDVNLTPEKTEKNSDSEHKSDKTSAVTETIENHVEEEAKSGDSALLDEANIEKSTAANETEGDEATLLADKPEDSELKPEESDPKSPGKSIDSSLLEESSQDATDSLAADMDKSTQETSTQDMSVDKDDVENPEFETAPETAEEPQEDHSQALDPFDALLKDTPAPETSTTASQADPSANEDDDHHNADDDQPPETDEPPEPADADDPVPLEEEPGADEEVMLLPDTEREISEADKAEAEKVLAEKRKLAEASEAMVPKEENEPRDPEEGAEVPNDEASTANLDEEVASQENGEKDPEIDQQDEEAVDDASVDKPEKVISEVSPREASCLQCGADADCSFQLTLDGQEKNLCSYSCVRSFQDVNPSYTVNTKKYLITEIAPTIMTCSECEEEKPCYFYYNYDGEDTNYCSMTCLKSMMADEADKYNFQRRKILVKCLGVPVLESCVVCEEVKDCTLSFERYGEKLHLCSIECLKKLNKDEQGRYVCRNFRSVKSKKTTPQTPPLLKLKVISNATDKYLDEAYKVSKTPSMIQAAREERERTFIRACVQCNAMINNDEKNLSWETMDFCNEECLGLFQNKIGSRCTNCKNIVSHTSLGKYCVRFGYDIRQFCKSGCLEEFKKGLKICCYCQKDISAGHQGFLAPVGDKGQFKDFCTQACMEKFDQMSKNPNPPPIWAKCAVCSLEKATIIEVELADGAQRLCSDPCFAAFKFVNNTHPDQCRWCKKYFERGAGNAFTIYEDAPGEPRPQPHCFCSKACINVYISNSRHIVPCSWCKVKKYNFDMIRRAAPAPRLAAGGVAPPPLMMCSLNCLNLYQVSVNAVSSRRIKCDMCKRSSQAQYHLTMSDATVRNFCTYQCVMAFQGQYSGHAALAAGGAGAGGAGGGPAAPGAVPAGAPRRTLPAPHKNHQTQQKSQQRTSLPVISNVQSLAAPPPLAPSRKKRNQQPPPEPPPPAPLEPPPPPPKPLTPPPPPPPKIYNHVLVKTLPPSEVANKATMTKPMMVSKGVSCRPHPCTKECQTDPSLERRILIPVPVPIYVPVPCAMWSIPFPIPVPIPLPIPTPVFIPTTRNSAKGIMKEINKIHDKMPTDPFEAELLMMAEMVAGDKKKDQSDSDTDDDNAAAESGFSPVGGMDGHAGFGEDMLQMALKMATEYEETPVDLESAMTASTITPSSHPGMPGLEGDAMHHHHMMVLEQQRAVAALRASAAPRKRAPAPPPAVQAPRNTRGKRRRAEPPPPPEPPREPAEKPDANMCLKYTFGVNAWKQWVMTKNAELEKSSARRKPFKSEILQLTADELNYSLCLFVKEVRKPNGSEYAPDTIYYLVLGIQQYLFENARIDNIFTDPYYEKFTDCLDEVARKFSVLYNDSQYIVTRVEEEHLWESKQLGAHSPHVLLSTLMFFNTKHFNLVTVDEHMQLSFSHIMKHWKRNPSQAGQAKLPGSRNVLLRFYPPQSALEANSRKKKVYEQQENEENPLRCPVKLYEFYISKCPESVRTRNDVFYLQPERSCVPDSPVWYSTQPLSRAALAKMLHRVKMVKEINIALLTS